MKPIGWHRPERSDTWHLYTERGDSYCGDFVIFGLGRPTDMVSRPPDHKYACSFCSQRRDEQLTVPMT